MKKKKDYTIELLAIIFIIAWLCSCNATRTISGPVTAVKGDTLTVNRQQFIVQGNAPEVGKPVTFIQTKNKKKVNSKKVN